MVRLFAAASILRDIGRSISACTVGKSRLSLGILLITGIFGEGGRWIDIVKV